MMSFVDILGAIGGGIKGGYSVIEAQKRKQEEDDLAAEAKAERQRVKDERIATRGAQHTAWDRNRASQAEDNGEDLGAAGDLVTGAGGIDFGGLPGALKVAGDTVRKAGKQPSEFNRNIDYGAMLDLQGQDETRTDRRRNTASTLAANKAYREAIDEDRDEGLRQRQGDADLRTKNATELATRGAVARKILGPDGEGLTPDAAVNALAQHIASRDRNPTGGSGGATDALERLIPKLQAKANMSEKAVPKGIWRPAPADAVDPQSPGMNLSGLPFNKTAFAAASADSTAKAGVAANDQARLRKAIDMSVERASPGFALPPAPEALTGGDNPELAAALSQVDDDLNNPAHGGPTPARRVKAAQRKIEIRQSFAGGGAETPPPPETTPEQQMAQEVRALQSAPRTGMPGEDMLLQRKLAAIKAKYAPPGPEPKGAPWLDKFGPPR